MGKLEDFYKNATDEQWVEIAEERNKVKSILDETKAAEASIVFRDKYGFYPDSVRPYIIMHFQELEKYNKMKQDGSADAELIQENTRLKAELEALKAQNNNIPSWHRMRGTPSKVTIYTTKEAFELYNKAVQWVADEYGCKKCYASAFVLEEALKRVGFHQEDNV